jgi:alpha-tubulin suppressor-like RCC1 family protein
MPGGFSRREGAIRKCRWQGLPAPRSATIAPSLRSHVDLPVASAPAPRGRTMNARGWLLLLLAGCAGPRHVERSAAEWTQPVADPSVPEGLCPEGVRRVSAGQSHSCALCRTGGVLCWGSDRYGQLGDSRDFSSGRARWVAGVHDAVDISAGGNHSCAVHASGQVTCWGGYFLGDGQPFEPMAPTPPGAPTRVRGIGDAVQVSVGAAHTCVRRAGGKVACWGWNEHGEIGDGTTQLRLLPVAVAGLDDAIDVSAGNAYTCAVRASGRVACWGRNDAGVLGADSRVRVALAPQEVPRVQGAVQVSTTLVFERELALDSPGSEEAQTCAVDRLGGVWCWGTPLDPRTGEWGVPARRSGIENAVAVSTAAHRACARLASGAVRCWGRGPLGDGTLEGTDADAVLVRLADVVDIALGQEHACAVNRRGEPYCWGNESLSHGQLGRAPSPWCTVEGARDVRAIALGRTFGCALRAEGGVDCWGSIHFLGPQLLGTRQSPVAWPGCEDVATIAASPSRVCLIRADGSVGCAPDLRDETAASGSVASLALGNHAVCLLRRDGTVGCGYGGTGNRVAGMPPAVEVSVGDVHGCARDRDGGVWCWGIDSYYRPAKEPTSAYAAAPVPAIARASALASQGTTTCAVHGEGRVSCWAVSPWHEPPTGVFTLPGVEHAKEVALSPQRICVRMEEGSVVCAAVPERDFVPLAWLDGDPWTRARAEAARAAFRLAPIPGLVDATQLAMSAAVGCVVRRDGSVACFDAGGQDAVHSPSGATPDPCLRRLAPERVHGVGP